MAQGSSSERLLCLSSCSVRILELALLSCLLQWQSEVRANSWLFINFAETKLRPVLPAPTRAGKTNWVHTPAPLLPQQPA